MARLALRAHEAALRRDGDRDLPAGGQRRRAHRGLHGRGFAAARPLRPAGAPAPERTRPRRQRSAPRGAARARHSDPALYAAQDGPARQGHAGARVERAPAPHRAHRDRRAARLVGAGSGAKARHPGGDRFPHQLPRLQPPLRLRLAREAGDGIPEAFSQPRRLHDGADRGAGRGARRPRLSRPAGGGPRRESRSLHPAAPLARAARAVGRGRGHAGRALREPLRAREELSAGDRGVRGDAPRASRRAGWCWSATGRSPKSCAGATSAT